MKPLSNYLLVEPAETEAKTKGGLHIPESATEKPQKGKILAAGPGHFEYGVLVPVQVVVGDVILYGKYAGTEVSLEGKSLLLLRSNEAMAIL